MIKYPSFLPGPLLAGYALNKKTNLLRTKMDSGQERVRRRFVNTPTIMPSTWMFNAQDAVTFEGFVEHALLGGVVWFELQIKTPLGIEYKQVRFITSPLEDCSPLSIEQWQYKASIEMKDRPAISEEALINRMFEQFAPYTFKDFVALTDMSRYYK